MGRYYFDINDMIRETGTDYFYVPAKISYIDKSGQIKTGTFDIKVPFSAAIDLKSSDALYPREEFGVRQLEWDLENFAENYESTILDYFRKQYDVKRIEQYEIFPDDIYFEKEIYEYLDKIKKEKILEKKEIKTRNLLEAKRKRYFTVQDIIDETGIDYFLVDARIKFIDRWDKRQESDTEIGIPFSEAVELDEKFPATRNGIKEFEYHLSDYIHDNYDELEDEVRDEYYDAREILDISIDTSPHLPREVRDYLNDLVGEIVEQKSEKRNIKMRNLLEAKAKHFTVQDIIDETGIDYFIVHANVRYIDQNNNKQVMPIQLKIPFTDVYNPFQRFFIRSMGVKKFKWGISDWCWDNIDIIAEEIAKLPQFEDVEIERYGISSWSLPEEVEKFLKERDIPVTEQESEEIMKIKRAHKIYEKLMELRELLLEKNPAKGWSKVAPKTKSERESVKQRGGASCFLDPKNLKFPVCRKTDAEFDCRGALAAYRRAKQYGYSDIAKKAINIAKRHSCDWAIEEKEE